MPKSKRLCETTGHQRLLWAGAAGAAMAAVPLPMTMHARGLLAWCLAASVYLVLAWWLAHTVDDADSTRGHAQAQDQPSVVLFALVLFIAFASTAAIAMLQQHVKDDVSGLERILHLALSVYALASSWLLIQTVFAFRYAHRFYGPDDDRGGGRRRRGKPRAADHHGGLDFPGDAEPDYLDFLYYSHVVGMTSQVSDVVVTSREMRYLTLMHSGLSFAFNMLVVALSINMMAGAIQ
ncbi:MAG: DUF1345 domain-containing protein [Comamonadaceae bacterium]|nr:MAG: DUF1345 domain-containing protein [Comamonadaceae bacterium]